MSMSNRASPVSYRGQGVRGRLVLHETKQLHWSTSVLSTGLMNGYAMALNPPP